MKKVEEIVNLTPHQINIMVGDEMMVIEPSGLVARCIEETVIEESLSFQGKEIKVISKVVLPVCENLPQKKDGRIYIVSLPVAEAVKNDRDDVYAIGEAIRDEGGRIVGAKSLSYLFDDERWQERESENYDDTEEDYEEDFEYDEYKGRDCEDKSCAFCSEECDWQGYKECEDCPFENDDWINLKGEIGYSFCFVCDKYLKNGRK